MSGYLSLVDETRLKLRDKRRRRLIYKWRHGLSHTCRPLHGDRGKLAFIEAWENWERLTPKPHPFVEARIKAATEALTSAIERQLFGDARA